MLTEDRKIHLPMCPAYVLRTLTPQNECACKNVTKTNKSMNPWVLLFYCEFFYSLKWMCRSNSSCGCHVP